MGLLDRRLVYKNENREFEYEPAYEFFEKQNQAHWVWTEVPMEKDLMDWKTKMSDKEQKVIGNILKSFAQAEVMVNDYWRNKVGLWFPKPEIGMMAGAFSNMEGIHTKAYAYLNEELDLEDYVAFLEDDAAKAKIDRLDQTSFDTTAEVVKLGSNCSIETKQNMAASLAIFSAFTEGVQLFSSFAVLLSFRRAGKMKGVANIVEWSVRDESMHSKAGCWLYRTFVNEYPEIDNDSLKDIIYQAADHTVELEKRFIDSIFEQGGLGTIQPKELKNFIKHRTNLKLRELGYQGKYSVDKDLLVGMEWFDNMTGGLQSTDFFDGVVTNYSKGNTNWSSIDYNVAGLKENFKSLGEQIWK